ncbi:MAG: SBBP repeat-containing protein [Bacteroidota bacterium]
MNSFLKVSCIILILVCSSSIYTYAQSSEWLLGKSFGSYGLDAANAITTDQQGNIYITGYFASMSITFGEITIRNSTSYHAQIFIAKFTPDGVPVWAKSFESNGPTNGYSITTDLNGNVFVMGINAARQLIIGIDTLSADDSQTFIAKFNSKDGTPLWARSTQSDHSVRGTKIVCNSQGHIYIIGYFYGSSVTFGSKTVYAVDTGNYSDIFIARYNSNGSILWALSFGGSNDESISGLTIDNNGNLLISGIFRSPNISVGSVSMNKSVTYLPLHSDAFIGKISASGTVLWLQPFGGDGDDNAHDIACDIKGNMYVIGYCASEIIKNGDTVLVLKAFDNNQYLMKLDSLGTVIWSKTGKVKGWCKNTSVVANEYGDIFISGYYLGEYCAFDNFTLQNTVSGTTDIFVARFTSDGIVKGVFTAAGRENDQCNGSIINKNGDIYIAGHFDSPTIRFGNTELVTSVFDKGSISRDIFIAKLHGSAIVSIDASIEVSPISIMGILQNVKVSNLTEGTWIIEIYNLQGQKIFQSEIIESNRNIDLSNLVKGAYIYQLQKDNEIVKTGKLILE